MPRPTYTPPPNPAPVVGSATFAADADGFLSWFPTFGTYTDDLAAWMETDFTRELNDGTVALPSLAFAADPNTGLYRIGGDTIGVSCGGSNVVQVSPTGVGITGNVGIGTNTPTTKLDVLGRGRLGGDGGDTPLHLRGSGTGVENGCYASFYEINGTTRQGYFGFSSTADSNFRIVNEASGDVILQANDSAGQISAFIGGSRKFLLTPGGDFLVGRSALWDFSSANTKGVGLNGSNGYIYASGESSISGYFKRYGTTGSAVAFFQDTTSVGTISLTETSTAYNTSSDERLKYLIAPTSYDSGAIIDSTNIVEYNWKADGSKQRFGLIAQKEELVFPEAITKGETPDDMWSIDYSKYVPVLLQEMKLLRQRLAVSEAKLAAL